MSVPFDDVPARVRPGRHHIVRMPGVLAILRSDGDGDLVAELLDLLRASSRTAPASPGRDVARRLTVWLGQADGSLASPPPGLAVVSASGDGLAIFLHGPVSVVERPVDAGPDTDRVALFGRDAAFTVDRLVPWPTGPLVLAADDAVDDDKEASLPDWAGFFAGVTPGSSVTLGRAAGPGSLAPTAEDAAEGTGADKASADDGAPTGHGDAPDHHTGAAERRKALSPSAATPDAPGPPQDATPSATALHRRPTADPAFHRRPTADPAFHPAPAPAPRRPDAPEQPAPPRLSEPIGRGPAEPARAPLPTATGLSRRAAAVAEPGPAAPPELAQSSAAEPRPAAPPEPAQSPAAAEPQAVPGRGPAREADEGVLVRGFRCSRNHLNDPRVSFCRLCGIRMDHLTGVLVEDRRPPLGLLVLDIGITFVLDHDYVLGRRPEADPDVREGRLRPIQLDDDSGALSRVHAEIRLTDWDVELVDRGSANGTFVATSQNQAWRRLAPHQHFVLSPGTHVLVGQRTFTFESSAARL